MDRAAAQLPPGFDPLALYLSGIPEAEQAPVARQAILDALGAGQLIAVYSGLPLLAPILMRLGYTWPAEIIYTLYGPHCHQLPPRSFFLFGPQPTYSLKTLQELLGSEMLADDSLARAFIGNATLGYKMAFCQRDTAMYGSMLLAGMLFGMVRRRLRSLPFVLYLVLLV